MSTSILGGTEVSIRMETHPEWSPEVDHSQVPIQEEMSPLLMANEDLVRQLLRERKLVP